VFVGEVDASTAYGVHGLDYEGEDIRVTVGSKMVVLKMAHQLLPCNGYSLIISV